MRSTRQGRFIVTGIILSVTLALSACGHSDLSHYVHARAAYQQKQYSKAIARLTPAATHGNSKAQYALGYMYYYGEGVKANQQLARAWFIKAAAGGNQKAAKALQLIDNPVFTKAEHGKRKLSRS